MSYAPLYVILCGLPASGKSSMRKYFKSLHKINYVASSDDIIERESKRIGKTYNEGFSEFVNLAQERMKKNISNYLIDEMNILDDQTNLTEKGRKNKLKAIPNNYITICYYFPNPSDDEWKRRLSSREGKIIPDNVLLNMERSFVMPSIDEGFNIVFTVNGTKL
jgi:tRNA uridine 5-carbamoylmethylation protein Kti12